MIPQFDLNFTDGYTVFNPSFQTKNLQSDMDFGTVTEIEKDVVVYDGETIVTPKIGEATVLPTQDKKMPADVTVKEVPIYRTSNNTGTTVYIGRVANAE